MSKLTKLTKGQRTVLAGAATLGVMFGSGSLSYAVWSDSTTSSPVSASTGMLDAEIETSNGYWRRSTPGYAAVQPCGPLAGTNDADTGCAATVDPSQVLTMPGDSIEYVIPVTTTMAGRNLAGAFVVNFADSNLLAAQAAGKIDLEFYIADGASGAQLAPPLGMPLQQAGYPLSVDSLVPGGSKMVNEYQVVAHLTVLGDYQWATGDDALTATGPLDVTDWGTSGSWDSGVLSVSLVQLRGDTPAPVASVAPGPTPTPDAPDDGGEN